MTIQWQWQTKLFQKTQLSFCFQWMFTKPLDCQQLWNTKKVALFVLKGSYCNHIFKYLYSPSNTLSFKYQPYLYIPSSTLSFKYLQVPTISLNTFRTYFAFTFCFHCPFPHYTVPFLFSFKLYFFLFFTISHIKTFSQFSTVTFPFPLFPS